ncbi:hypothetical protein T09_1536 [Trichinella sp. T9]|nr:hypothetical protein T09_1536 [Trichinella sp. T9]
MRKLLEVEPCSAWERFHFFTNYCCRSHVGTVRIYFSFRHQEKWEEEVFLDDAKNSDLAWFPSFLKKQMRNEHSVARTQLLGHLRSAKAIKAHANAEKVTTAAALEAKAESQSNSCAFCGGAHHPSPSEIFTSDA